MPSTIFTGTGSYIPERIVTNAEFGQHVFYNEEQVKLPQSGEVIVRKFKDITGIEERRYVTNELHASDIGAIAARRALDDAKLTGEEIDQIIVAHNFGDVRYNTIQTDVIPGLSPRIKHLLGIKNPECIAYDILFGCPGWLQGVIQAHNYIQGGAAKKCLVIGAETLSRVLDQNDRDSMIFSDGAGASVLELASSQTSSGILSYSVRSDTTEEAYYLFIGKSNLPESDPRIRYIKMKGRKIYEYALSNVPAAMKVCLDKAGVDVSQLKKVLIHQANAKMDHAIIERLYELYGVNQVPEDIMPMSIDKLGNSSV
ncbi:MAG: 3-oxoacyl-ACP synthase III family protein, partial [Chitinophagales bacterium]